LGKRGFASLRLSGNVSLDKGGGMGWVREASPLLDSPVISLLIREGKWIRLEEASPL